MTTRPGAPLAHLLHRAVASSRVGESGSDVDRDDDRDAAILDAAVVVIGRRGAQEATIEDVARESGASRTTLYRRFGTKDELFERALSRTIRDLLSALSERFRSIPDPADQVVDGFAMWLQLQNHPLFGNDDPGHRGELIRALTDGAEAPIHLAHRAVSDNIARAQALGKLPAADPDQQADVLVHLALGYLATPSLTGDLTDLAAAENLARAAIAPILYGPPPV